MKKILKLMMLMAILLGTVACSDDNEPELNDIRLEANYITTHGTWVLTSWKGQPVADGIYCYISLNRKEHTFEMYENMDSMTSRHITGSFSIDKDENDESVTLITGSYDFGNGKWNNSYELQVYEGRMIWTVSDDHSDISVYERCDEIPSDIINILNVE